MEKLKTGLHILSLFLFVLVFSTANAQAFGADEQVTSKAKDSFTILKNKADDKDDEEEEDFERDYIVIIG